MKLFTSATLAAAIATITLTANVQASDPNSNYRYYSPNVEISKDYRLNKRVDTRIDNSRHSSVKKDYRYNLDQLKAKQTYNQKRRYESTVSQGAANTSGNQGHVMGQYQGGTTVSTSSADSRSHGQSGFNLASPSASSHNGMSYKGNFEMYGSQIGANQSGFQGGDNTNLQNNSQTQYGSARTGSLDYLRNGNRN